MCGEACYTGPRHSAGSTPLPPAGRRVVTAVTPPFRRRPVGGGRAHAIGADISEEDTRAASPKEAILGKPAGT
eukprot:gene12251-36693_t